ncbi:hypothetical protein [Thermostaphylospora chromogena]|mgnify:CR=1 FL=1|uniref:Uncharacterized protein n=1 Tax=Thermostaphylospora chromogena TaxID=35622 RepID=A0A1H1CKC5_9ACTN|nr:hypothetical protein [Thermostaphylospora chromogena]SDQ64600.1 hypothetical protein SAMN04489764_1519 [Thermostaphylospora chromogena]
MADPAIHELRERASKLRAFAEHVQELPDRVHTEAARMDWSGPLTDRVRSEIGTWKTRCGDVADRIREEADRLDEEANRLTQRAASENMPR